MKKLIFSFFLLLSGSIALNAQKAASATPTPSASDLEARKTTEALTAKYGLSADQAKQMYTIQVRKQKNMAQILSVKDTDPALYLAKAQNVQKSTLVNIRRILQSKEQVDIYQKTQSEIRGLRALKQKEMAAQKASRSAIETTLLGIYAE